MGSLSNLLFYIIVKDKAVRESLRVLLESYDAAVHTYVNGRSFLMNSHNLKPGFVLLEDDISDTNTFDLLNKIYNKFEQSHIVLFTNTKYNNYTKQEIEQSGIATILHKPIDSIKLLETINTLQ